MELMEAGYKPPAPPPKATGPRASASLGHQPESATYSGPRGGRGKWDPKTGTGRSALIGSEEEATHLETLETAAAEKEPSFFSPMEVEEPQAPSFNVTETSGGGWDSFYNVITRDWGATVKDALPDSVQQAATRTATRTAVVGRAGG